MTAPPDLPKEKIEELEAKARAATAGSWDGMFCSYAGLIDDPSSKLGFKFAPARYPIADLSKVSGVPEVGKGLLAEACSEEDRKHIAAFDPPTALTLCAMAKAKIEAEERVRELEAVITQNSKLVSEEHAQEAMEIAINIVGNIRSQEEPGEFELTGEEAAERVLAAMAVAQDFSSLSLPEKDGADG